VWAYNFRIARLNGTVPSDLLGFPTKLSRKVLRKTSPYILGARK